MLKVIGRWILTAAGILLVTSVLSEVMLRGYHHFRPLYCFYDQSYNRFRGKSFAPDWDFHLNSKGFKDLEFTVEKQVDVRILGLGDSFAFGVVPYRFNYFTILEEILCRSGWDAEVINMGIPGTGPREYLNLLLAEGLILNPDLVIISFFVGNDFSDAAGLSSRIREKLYQYSYLASYVHYLIRVVPRLGGWEAHGAREYDDDAPNFTEEAFLALERERSYICQRDNRCFRGELDIAVSVLEDTRSTCADRGIALLVLIIPDEMQVNRELQSMIISGFPESISWDWSQPNRRLAEKLEELGIAYLDLYESLRKASLHTSLYRRRDTHWNIAGNDLAARLLGQKLLESGKFHHLTGAEDPDH